MKKVKVLKKGNPAFVPVSKEHMEKVVAAVDAIREKEGLNIVDAVKKSKLNIHYSTYYNYRNQLNGKPRRDAVAPKAKKTKFDTSVAGLIPLKPHTIEYIDKKPRNDLLMVMGPAGAILDLIEKMRG